MRQYTLCMTIQKHSTWNAQAPVMCTWPWSRDRTIVAVCAISCPIVTEYVRQGQMIDGDLTIVSIQVHVS